MCQHCPSPDNANAFLPRRNFLKLAGSAALGLGLAANLQAASNSAPPKPQNVLTPDEALDYLIKGNKRYVKGTTRRHDFQAERLALALGQNPYAGILSCADSRVAPELAFDTGRGDLFVCRVAGNFCNKDNMASFEYAVSVLGTPLLVVLGHQSCGAISSTIKAVKEGVDFPGHIPHLIKSLRPAVTRVLHEPGDLLENSIRNNVLLNVAKLKEATPIISKAVDANKVRVAGAIYELETGQIRFIV